MTTTTRTDAHRPTELITEDYEYLETYDARVGERIPFGAIPAHVLYLMKRLAVLRGLVESSPLAERSLDQCHHCGAHIRYGAVLKHIPTGQYIAVGETCLDNRFERTTADFQQLRKSAQLDREAMRIRTAVAAFVEAHPTLAWMADQGQTFEATTNDFLRDVARKLRQYGDLSERQIVAVYRAAWKQLEFEAKRSEQPAEVPCPHADGQRVEIRGQIVGVKFYDNDFGTVTKLMVLVPSDGGAWKLWVTCPSSLDAEKGADVHLRVKLQHTDDPTFVKGSRPTVVR